MHLYTQLPHQRREHVDGLHPSKYAYLLSTDEELRFYEAGRLHFREEHLEAPDFRRLVNALVGEETGEGTSTELEWSVDDVAAFFRLFDSSSFLVSASRQCVPGWLPLISECRYRMLRSCPPE